MCSRIDVKLYLDGVVVYLIASFVYALALCLGPEVLELERANLALDLFTAEPAAYLYPLKEPFPFLAQAYLFLIRYMKIPLEYLI